MTMRKLEEELKQYAASDMYPFHMPGHKRRGDAVCRTDITEIDGFDNLHDPEDLIRGEMDFAKAFYGTKETYFLVNGSTVGILTAISAAVRPGGRILIERGCHISVYHAAYLRGLHIDYLDFGERSGQRPDAIVINLGTNDDSYCQEDQSRQQEYTAAYVEFLKVVRKHNPGAIIFCVLGLMGDRLYPSVCEAAKAYTEQTGDVGIHTVHLPEQDASVGYVSDYHPLESAHEKAAKVLVPEIKRIMNW